MPKKFIGENTKATVARARKAAVALEEKERKEKEIEDEYWKDENKNIQRKQQRKEEKEKKRVEQLEHKKTLQTLHDEEMEGIKSAKPTPSAKVTRAEIQAQATLLEKQSLKQQQEKPRLVSVDDDEPIPENINRLVLEGQEARTVDEAISVLSISEDLDKHPEKRMKAAYLAYEEKNLPILKQENPNMRLSQLKQILKKDWMKSPQNPLNQRHMVYNSKKT